MNSPHYRLGSTSRITVRVTVASIREDPCTLTGDTPEKLYRYWQEVVAAQPDHEPDKESLVVVMLNTRLRPFAWHRVSVGTLNECPAHPREIFRPVITAGAYAFILLHNHPSGVATAGRDDEAITRRIAEGAKLLQIRFLDHIIVGEEEPGRAPYFSFREGGIIS